MVLNSEGMQLRPAACLAPGAGQEGLLKPSELTPTLQSHIVRYLVSWPYAIFRARPPQILFRHFAETHPNFVPNFAKFAIKFRDLTTKILFGGASSSN